jgi:hypothetical protein
MDTSLVVKEFLAQIEVRCGCALRSSDLGARCSSRAESV